MMNLDAAPEHLVIVGGSYVGLEFGQMFRRFGSAVTIVEMASRLVQREDEDVSASVHAVLTSEGIAVRLNARCISLAGDQGRVVVEADCAEGSPAVEDRTCCSRSRPNTRISDSRRPAWCATTRGTS
jgi:pyruvate/2-oxoglutarate dehydrogenase complex dihydrolipoamide dehydrogenase (E3) component